MPQKKKSPSKPRFHFDGIFTDEVRMRIREKRCALGLPYHLIAKYFGINWSTFRKWEMGGSVGCELTHRPTLEAFINGDLDCELKTLFGTTGMKYPQPTPQKVYQAMERIANTYTLCSAQRPDIGDELLSQLEQLSFDTLRNLIAQPRVLSRLKRRAAAEAKKKAPKKITGKSQNMEENASKNENTCENGSKNENTCENTQTSTNTSTSRRRGRK